MGGGGGVVNLFILGPGIVCFVCVGARASKLLWKVPDPWQEAPARLFPKLWAGAGSQRRGARETSESIV